MLPLLCRVQMLAANLPHPKGLHRGPRLDVCQSPRHPVVTRRLYWIAAALGGAACVAASFLPAFQVRLEASIGGGDTQQGFDYERTWSLVEYGTWFAIAAVVACVLLTVVAVAGLRAGTTTALLVALGVIALGLGAFTTAAGFNEDMLGGFGQESCPSWSDCGGFVLGPAVRELHRDALEKPEAKDPEYLLDPGYAAEPRLGWRVIQVVVNLLLVVAAFAVFRRRREFQAAGPAFAVLAVVAIWVWSDRVDTTDGLSTSASAEGGIAFYGALLAAIAAIAALLSKRWKLGVATLVLALASGFWVWLVLLAAGLD